MHVHMHSMHNMHHVAPLYESRANSQKVAYSGNHIFVLVVIIQVFLPGNASSTSLRPSAGYKKMRGRRIGLRKTLNYFAASFLMANISNRGEALRQFQRTRSMEKLQQ